MRKVAVNGIITTYAGNGGTAVNGGDGGKATSATMGSNYGCAFDTSFNLYIIPTGDAAVRCVAKDTSYITRYAGNGLFSLSSGDGGPATSASFKFTYAIFMDTLSNLFIAEQTAVIRKVSAIGGLISTYAGTNGVTTFSGTGGPATSAGIVDYIRGVIGDTVGNIFLSSTYRVHRVDSVSLKIKVIAGCLFSI